MSAAEPALDEQEGFFKLRARAFELADTGGYKNWSHVAYVLLAERFPPSAIKRLNEDRLAVMMISRICEKTRVSPVSLSEKIWSWVKARRDQLR
jgi:hypothetical protein